MVRDALTFGPTQTKPRSGYDMIKYLRLVPEKQEFRNFIE